MATAAVTAYHGSHSRNRSTVRRPQSIESLTGLKKNEKLQWVVWLLITQRRASSIQSASGIAHDSGNPPTELSTNWGGDHDGHAQRELPARARSPAPVDGEPGLDGESGPGLVRWRCRSGHPRLPACW